MSSRKKTSAPTILSIEDNLIAQNLYENFCRLLGINLILASTGQSGIQEAIANQASIRFILLDIGLPDMSGFEVAKALRRAGVMMPIMVVSAQKFTLKEQNKYVDLIDAFCQKPLTMKNLEALIQQYFSPDELEKRQPLKENKSRKSAFRQV